RPGGTGPTNSRSRTSTRSAAARTSRSWWRSWKQRPHRKPSPKTDRPEPPGLSRRLGRRSLQVDVDRVLATLDGVGQLRLADVLVVLRNGEPTLDLRHGLRRRTAFAHDWLEVAALRIDAADGGLGLAGGHVAHGVGAVGVDVRLLEQLVTPLEL